MTTADGCSTARRPACPERSRRFPIFRSPSWRRPKRGSTSRLAAHTFPTRSRSSTSPSASDGTITGSGCCCEMDPAYADGWVNVARAQIQEGNVSAAEPLLRRALALDSQLARAHFFLGTVLKTLGQYDEALAHLRTAAAQYPRDRVVLNQIGRILFLQRRFDEAIPAFKQVLTIDPEDLQAHYNLMLCYQGAGNATLAETEQALYARFKADESSQFITGSFRLRSPDDNNERQSIHEHRSARTAPPSPAPRRLRQASTGGF
ncbi:MAG: hypothetical protein DMG03_26700 [Acidobacteria bacterium]|nr:MAG: hypothetical protein DMG03_26700 [Acidobacteriota bacterium]